MNRLLKIVRESVISFSGECFGKPLNYVWLMIITRFLSPEEFGTFILANSVINISLIFVLFGTPSALDRFIPYYNAAGEDGKTKKLILYILKTTMALSVMVGIVLVVVSDLLSTTLFNNTTLAPVLKILILSIPLLTFIQVVSSSFIGFKELRYYIYFNHITLPTLRVVLSAIIFSLGYGLLGLTWIHILSLSGAALLAYWFFRKNIITSLSKINEQSISVRRIFSYSWPLSINNIIIIFLAQVDFILLGVYRPSADVGIYRIYLVLVGFLSLALSSFAKIYKPTISELIFEEKVKEVKEIYKRVSKWIFNINAFLFLVILLLGTSIIALLFTKNYLESPASLIILAAGIFINSSFGPEGMTLEAYGNTKLSMLNGFLMLITNIGLNLVLIPKYGIVGAAIATATSLTIGGLSGIVEIYVLYRLQPFRLEHFKYLAIALSVGSTLYVLQLQIAKLNILGLIVLVIILAGLYIIGLYLTRSLDAEDYQVFARVKAKIIGEI